MPSLLKVMWPEKLPSKYLRKTSSVRSLTRPRNASLRLMLFPEIRRVIAVSLTLRRLDSILEEGHYPDLQSVQSARTGGLLRELVAELSARQHQRALLLAATLHGGGDTHRLAIFRDRSACDVYTRFTQFLHDAVVRQDRVGVLGIDQLLDVMAHRFRRMRFAPVGRGDRGREEIFQLEGAAIGCHVFVGGHARDRRFMHLDRVSHRLEIERPQVRQPMG